MLRLFIRLPEAYISRNNFGPIRSLVNIAKDSKTNHLKINDKTNQFVKLICKKLNCPKNRAALICASYSGLNDTKLKGVAETMELLLDAGVQSNIILDNVSILTQGKEILKTNLATLRDMKPSNINDFAPLLGASTSKLRKIKQISKEEENVVPLKNRIYYLSYLMKIEPSVITKALSKHLFVLQLPYTTFNQCLTIMLKYIAPEDILNDLFIFRYSPNVIESRLIQAKKGHKTKLMPWMVKCLEHHFLKSIKLSSDKKAVLGEKSLAEYLSCRLQFDIQTIENILKKHPQVTNVRVTRMKEILDYLLDDAGYTPLDIAKVPRIFCHSLKTTKERLNELQSHGCRPQSLSVVCRSTNEYRKFLNGWISLRKLPKK